jgi:hypothetical protein
MEHSIQFGGEPQDVTITTSGPATREGLTAFLMELVSSPRFRPGMLILADHSALDPTTVTAAEVRAQAHIVVGLNGQIGASKIAIVVPNALAFGWARMYELSAQAAQAESNVFYSRSDALAWLELQRSNKPAEGP